MAIAHDLHRAPDPSVIAHLHRRDRVMDLVRCLCLLVVVLLHASMSTAQLGTDGHLEPVVALIGTPLFTAATWIVQIMPLFFVVGGFASLSQWRRIQAQGLTWTDYLRTRLRRLVAPVAVLIAGTGLAITVAASAGVPSDLLAEASLRIGQPLWFLAVYVGLTSLVPIAAHLHERAPRRTLLALASGVIVVDVLVRTTGLGGLGYLNLLFVWPLMQQCGFVVLDTIHRPTRRGASWALVIVPIAVLGVLVALGVYHPSMLVNLNPPTGALALLGLSQIGVLRLVHPWMSRAVGQDANWRADRRDLAAQQLESSVARDDSLPWIRVIDWGNKYGMHVYLWHMPIALVLLGVLGRIASFPVLRDTVLSDVLLPAMYSPWWWLTRTLWIGTVLVVAGVVAQAMFRVDVPGDEQLSQWGSVVGRRLGELARRTRERHDPAGHGQSSRLLPAGSVRLAASLVTRKEVRAGMAVASAIAGILIALLAGVAPLGWTLLSAGLLLVSLVLGAGLASSQREESPVHPA